MPILSGGPLYRDKTKVIEDYPASTGEVFGAAVARAFDTGVSDFFALGQEHFIGTVLIAKDPERFAVRGSDAKAEAAKRNVTLDLADDATISRPELDTMLRLKERERKQLQTLNRRPQTWGGFAAEMGGGIVGTLTDPSQVAASFIPVVGQARYAKWIAAARGPLGRAGVRAGVGAAEGFVGSAIIEPFVYTRAQSLGLEYDSTDSFMNFVFGTVLGGGLHALGGAVYDRATGAYREVPDAKSRAALLEAITALDAGRELDVNTILRDGRAMGAAASVGNELDGFGDRVLFRGMEAGAEDVFRVSDRGPLGAGVYLSENSNVAGRYGPDVVEARVRGEILDATSQMQPSRASVEERVLPHLTDEQRARYEEVTRPATEFSKADEVIGGLSRTLQPEEMRDALKRAGYAGVDMFVDGPETVVFDPANLIKDSDYKARMAEREAAASATVKPDSYDPATGIEPPEMEQLRQRAEAAARAPEADSIDGEIEALNEVIDAGRARGTLNAADEKELAAVAAIDSYAAKAVRATKAAASCIIGVA